MKCVLTNGFMRSASPNPIHRRVRFGARHMSRPADPGPTRLADPNRSPGRETIYTIYILYCTGTLIDLFFLRAVLVPVVYKQFL